MTKVLGQFSDAARAWAATSSEPYANMCSVHAAAVRDAAKQLAAQGMNDCEIARRLELPRTTIRDWRTRA